VGFSGLSVGGIFVQIFFPDFSVYVMHGCKKSTVIYAEFNEAIERTTQLKNSQSVKCFICKKTTTIC